MKKILSVSLLLASFFFPLRSLAYTEYAVLVKDGFGGSDHALLYTRESRYGTYGFYVISYGIGCGMGMWKYESKNVIVNTSYSSFLDGVSDTLILPKTTQYGSTYSCKIWNVVSLRDAFNALDSDDVEWLSDNGFMAD